VRTHGEQCFEMVLTTLADRTNGRAYSTINVQNISLCTC